MSKRGGFSMVEMLVAFGIFALCSGAALRTIYYNRRAADTTLRVGNLQAIRTVLDRLSRDLREAVAVETPGWSSAAEFVSYRDGAYHRVTFYPADSEGRRLTGAALDTLAPNATIQLIRQEEAEGSPPTTQRIDKGIKLRKIRFFRLGRHLLGFRLELRGNASASTAALRRGERYSSVVSLSRQVL